MTSLREQVSNWLIKKERLNEYATTHGEIYAIVRVTMSVFLDVGTHRG